MVHKGQSNIVDGHLRGALSVLSENPVSNYDPAGQFLERVSIIIPPLFLLYLSLSWSFNHLLTIGFQAFRFFDLIAALSFGKSPLSSGLPRNMFGPVEPLNSRGTASPHDSVDALLGMATPLWPVLYQLSSLVSLRDEIETVVLSNDIAGAAALRSGLEAKASTIEATLHRWEPEMMPMPVHEALRSEVHSRMQSISHSALAYRHSALVFLYRTIYNYPRDHPIVQTHTHTSLIHCAETANHGGPMGALLWPLFVASCEALNPEDRERSEVVFAALHRRQGMVNISRAWTVVTEVWKRVDENPNLSVDQQGSMGDLWRDVTDDLNMMLIFA